MGKKRSYHYSTTLKRRRLKLTRSLNGLKAGSLCCLGLKRLLVDKSWLVGYLESQIAILEEEEVRVTKKPV